MKGRAAWVSVGALLLGMIGVMLWKRPESSGEWASWAQAIGTVAALFGVLWVAHADERRKRNEQLANAAVTAAILLQNMPVLIGVVNATIFSIDWALPESEVLPHLQTLRDGLDRAPLPSEEQMLRIVPIDASLGQTLAHSVGFVAQARAYLAAILSDAEEDDHDHLQDTLQGVVTMLRPALDGLQQCNATLEKFNAAAAPAASAASAATTQTPP